MAGKSATQKWIFIRFSTRIDLSSARSIEMKRSKTERVLLEFFLHPSFRWHLQNQESCRCSQARAVSACVQCLRMCRVESSMLATNDEVVVAHLHARALQIIATSLNIVGNNDESSEFRCLCTAHILNFSKFFLDPWMIFAQPRSFRRVFCWRRFFNGF